jgi:putative ABC transport system substrate-binding protein
LRELGWIEGHTIAIEYRWADGSTGRLPNIAAEFARLRVDVIVTAGTPAAIAVKQATSVIPIVFATTGDPIGNGLVATLARPGGNATGLSTQQTDLAGKRLELLRELVPRLSRLAILTNISNPSNILEREEVRTMARALGVEVITLEIRRAEDIPPEALLRHSKIALDFRFRGKSGHAADIPAMTELDPKATFDCHFANR